jgi:hypothetical protein
MAFKFNLHLYTKEKRQGNVDRFQSEGQGQGQGQVEQHTVFLISTRAGSLAGPYTRPRFRVYPKP